MTEEPANEMSVEPAPTPKSTSRWIVRPAGAMIAVGVLVGGYVLSSLVGNGTTDTLASDDRSAVEVPVMTLPGGPDASIGSQSAPSLTTSPQVLPSVSTVPADQERRIVITGFHEGCKFGADCIVAGFELVNFDPVPEQFTCEFSNSSFPFNLRGRTKIDRACMSGDLSDTITIVADGVRSETISRDSIG